MEMNAVSEMFTAHWKKKNEDLLFVIIKTNLRQRVLCLLQQNMNKNRWHKRKHLFLLC